MKPECSLQCSQEHATGPYPEAEDAGRALIIYFIYSNVSQVFLASQINILCAFIISPIHMTGKSPLTVMISHLRRTV
jgi:hypothetical protein